MAKSTATAADGGDLRKQWRARLARFEGQGRSVAQFCAAEAVSKWAFYYWRRRLAAAVPRTAVLAKPKVSTDPDGATGFIDAGVAHVGTREPRSTLVPPASVELRLELGGGVVLQVMRR